MFKDLLQQIPTTGEKAFIRICVLVVFVYGASLASAFNFCDPFWQIFSMCSLNFNLQLNVMRSRFSLRELFMCKALTLNALCS